MLSVIRWLWHANWRNTTSLKTMRVFLLAFHLTKVRFLPYFPIKWQEKWPKKANRSNQLTRINFISRQLIAPNNQTSRDLKFDVIEIQGGGRVEIQSDREGLSVTCRTLWIRSGAILTADRLKITCQSVTIEQSGIIDLNYKVSLCYFVIYIKVISKEKFWLLVIASP